MRVLSLIAMLAIGRVLVGAALAADAPPGATSCSGCHAGAQGVDTPAPRLAGLTAENIETAMREFRVGQRQATIMDRIAKGFSEAEVAAIAHWYAAQKN